MDVTKLAATITALGVIFGAIFAAYRWFLKQEKQDKEIKEPYTDEELKRLLARPRSDSWVEWRTWAAINYMVATGNRISTVLNVKIRDVNFAENTIRLTFGAKKPGII